MIPNSRVIIIHHRSGLQGTYETVVKSLDRLNLVNSYPDYRAAGTSLSIDRPDIVLLDISASPVEYVKGIVDLRRMRPSVKILVVAQNNDITSKNVIETFSAGAWGIVNREAPDFDLAQALREIRQGGTPMTISVATTLVTSFHRNPHSPFTNREQQIMEALGNGKSYESIAGDLSIGTETVKTHVRHIYNKLQVNNKSAAIQKARHKNLI